MADESGVDRYFSCTDKRCQQRIKRLETTYKQVVANVNKEAEEAVANVKKEAEEKQKSSTANLARLIKSNMAADSRIHKLEEQLETDKRSNSIANLIQNLRKSRPEAEGSTVEIGPGDSIPHATVQQTEVGVNDDLEKVGPCIDMGLSNGDVGEKVGPDEDTEGSSLQPIKESDQPFLHDDGAPDGGPAEAHSDLFTCEQCETSFVTKRSLDSHVKGFHPVTKANHPSPATNERGEEECQRTEEGQGAAEEVMQDEDEWDPKRKNIKRNKLSSIVAYTDGKDYKVRCGGGTLTVDMEDLLKMTKGEIRDFGEAAVATKKFLCHCAGRPMSDHAFWGVRSIKKGIPPGLLTAVTWIIACQEKSRRFIKDPNTGEVKMESLESCQTELRHKISQMCYEAKRCLEEGNRRPPKRGEEDESGPARRRKSSKVKSPGSSPRRRPRKRKCSSPAALPMSQVQPTPQSSSSPPPAKAHSGPITRSKAAEPAIVLPAKKRRLPEQQ